MATNHLVLSFGLPGLNEIIKVAKRHHMAYASMKKKYTQMVETELIAQGCIPDKPYAAIAIEFEWVEGVNRGIIPNDTRKEVRILRDLYPAGKERAVIVRWHEVQS